MKNGINFLGYFKFLFPITIILTFLSIYIWIERGESKWGLDFTGGHEIVVRVAKGTQADQIRKAIPGDPVVQSFEIASSEFSIRIADDSKDSTKVVEDITKSLKAHSWGENVEILKSDYVGPTVGKELRSQALMASVIGALCILLYVTIRFEFAFALGAIVALFHDVVLSVGVYLLSGYTMSMGTIAGVLTIIGYSVNDTIIIFDRIREEISQRRSYNLYEVINESINKVLKRTLITNGLTLFSALALFLFGGGSLQDFTIFLVLGVVFGAYSTVYIASPVVLAWHKFRGGKLEVRE
jgi:preprotein translocase subunit SecF